MSGGEKKIKILDMYILMCALQIQGHGVQRNDHM